MSKETRQHVIAAVGAIEAKKGEDLVILEMDQKTGAFTDYFVVCTGTNPRQIQALSDEVERQLIQLDLRPNSVEGYTQAEWVLLDYVDFVVHIFSERSRKFYDLERLWKSATRLTPATLAKPSAQKSQEKKVAVRKPAAKKKAARKAAPRRSLKARSASGTKGGKPKHGKSRSSKSAGKASKKSRK